MKTPRKGTGDGLPTYRQSLLAAMKILLVAPLFAKWPVADSLRWKPRLIACAALLMVWQPAVTLGDRLAEVGAALAELFPGSKRVGRTYQGFIKAWIAWSPRLLAALETHWRILVRQAAGDRWTHQGWVPLGVDGSRVAVPHTAANLKAFDCGGKDHSGPSAWLVTILHLGLNLPWAWKIAKATADERGLLRQMLHLLPACTLLIADAGYTGYAFWRALQDAGHSFLIRVGANTRLLTELGYAVEERDGIVYVWPHRQARAGEPPLVLRLIVLCHDSTPVYLLTNVLDPAKLTDVQAAEFYLLRWHLELFFRALKSTLGKRAMRSHAPVQAALELRWAVLGLALLGLWTVQSQMAEGCDPRKMSLAEALRHVRVVLRNPARRCRRHETLAARLARAVQDDYVRRGPKHSADWPHKKNDGPPKAPQITPASAEQILAAQALIPRLRAA